MREFAVLDNDSLNRHKNFHLTISLKIKDELFRQIRENHFLHMHCESLYFGLKKKKENETNY